MARDFFERPPGADDIGLPDVAFGFAPSAKKKWRPSTMAPLPPPPAPVESRPPMSPIDVIDDELLEAAPRLPPAPPPTRGLNVPCKVCGAGPGRLCLKKSGAPAPGVHPQRLAASLEAEKRAPPRPRGPGVSSRFSLSASRGDDAPNLEGDDDGFGHAVDDDDDDVSR